MSHWRPNSIDIRLISLFVTPSWVSVLVAIIVGLLVTGGTIIITHFGGTVQQSLLGLHMAYQHSSVGANVGQVSAGIANNGALNSSLLFVLWGSVGLLVYSITHGIVNEFREADEIIHELGYVHANRRTILLSVSSRAAIRILAFVLWWLLLRTLVYRLIPYGIATAHESALHFTSVFDWGRTLFTCIVCMIYVHVLAVFARLTLMRPRVFDNEFIG